MGIARGKGREGKRREGSSLAYTVCKTRSRVFHFNMGLGWEFVSTALLYISLV